ncbi:MAG: hypothetical protein R2742_07755 [Micropruina glycogenica]
MPRPRTLRMRADGMPAGGVDVFYRSLAKQTELYHLFREGKGNLAAKPSPATHRTCAAWPWTCTPAARARTLRPKRRTSG